MKPSFSTSEVATFCHVTADTIRKWAEAGRIKVFKTPGGHRRIRREDLLRFLRDHNIPIHEDLSNSATRILIAEHDKAVASMIRRCLERVSVQIEAQMVADAFDAGRAIASFRPHVIFLDMRLPGVDMMDVCRRIKSSPESSHANILALGTPEGVGSESVMALGLTSCLRKPFTPDDLRRALAKVGIELN